jgi:hypothetical protein
MNTEPLEILSAFVDGEVVDPLDLAESLASPGAMAAIEDIARLRAAMRADASKPSPQFYAAIEEIRNAGPRGQLGRMRAVRLGIAAIVLIGLGVAAGWMFRWGSGTGSPARPPDATREVHFVQGVDWWGRS